MCLRCLKVLKGVDVGHYLESKATWIMHVLER